MFCFNRGHENAKQVDCYSHGDSKISKLSFRRHCRRRSGSSRTWINVTRLQLSQVSFGVNWKLSVHVKYNYIRRRHLNCFLSSWIFPSACNHKIRSAFAVLLIVNNFTIKLLTSALDRHTAIPWMYSSHDYNFKEYPSCSLRFRKHFFLINGIDRTPSPT